MLSNDAEACVDNPQNFDWNEEGWNMWDSLVQAHLDGTLSLPDEIIERWSITFAEKAPAREVYMAVIEKWRVLLESDDPDAFVNSSVRMLIIILPKLRHRTSKTFVQSILELLPRAYSELTGLRKELAGDLASTILSIYDTPEAYTKGLQDSSSRNEMISFLTQTVAFLRSKKLIEAIGQEWSSLLSKPDALIGKENINSAGLAMWFVRAFPLVELSNETAASFVSELVSARAFKEAMDIIEKWTSDSLGKMFEMQHAIRHSPFHQALIHIMCSSEGQELRQRGLICFQKLMQLYKVETKVEWYIMWLNDCPFVQFKTLCVQMCRNELKQLLKSEADDFSWFERVLTTLLRSDFPKTSFPLDVSMRLTFHHQIINLVQFLRHEESLGALLESRFQHTVQTYLQSLDDFLNYAEENFHDESDVQVSVQMLRLQLKF